MGCTKRARQCCMQSDVMKLAYQPFDKGNDSFSGLASLTQSSHVVKNKILFEIMCGNAKKVMEMEKLNSCH